jgi:hypothetical protein
MCVHALCFPCEVVCDLMIELQDQCHLACFSEAQSPEAFQYSVTQVKDKLLEECFFCDQIFFFLWATLNRLCKRSGKLGVALWGLCSRSFRQSQMFLTFVSQCVQD